MNTNISATAGAATSTLQKSSPAPTNLSNSSPELGGISKSYALDINLPPNYPPPNRPIPALPESPTCPGLITPPAPRKSRKSKSSGLSTKSHNRKSSFQGGGLVLSGQLSAERKKLGGNAVRFSTVYGNNVLVGEGMEGLATKGRMSGMLGRKGSVVGRTMSVEMSPLPPVPKIPAALAGGGTLRVNFGGRDSFVSLHSTVNGPLPEYFDNNMHEAAVAVAVGAIQYGENDEIKEWDERVSRSTTMRRSHSIRSRSRSASRPGKIRARMPSTLSRASSRSSTRSAATPRSIKRSLSTSSRISSRTPGQSPQIGTATTPPAAQMPFAPVPMPTYPAPFPPPPPHTPLPSIPVDVIKKKERKAKPGRIMLPQEIMAMEARRASRKDEMRLLMEQQETIMKPIQENGESSDNDEGFITEDDAEVELMYQHMRMVVEEVDEFDSSDVTTVAAAVVSSGSSLNRAPTTRSSRKPVPSRSQVYSIFPTSPRRGSQGQLVFPPPIAPGTRNTNLSVRSPGMASPLSGTKPQSPMKALRRRRTARKSTISSPTPRVRTERIALTPLKVPVMVTPDGEIVATNNGTQGPVIPSEKSEDTEAGLGQGPQGKQELTSILNRPRPKKPRPPTRGKSTIRKPVSQGHASRVEPSRYLGIEESSSSEDEAPELPRRGPQYDSEIYVLMPTAASTTGSSSPTTGVSEEGDETDQSHVDSITRLSLRELRESFYEELRRKYSKVTSGFTSDSEEEEFVGGVLHMGTPPLDSDVEGESDDQTSYLGDSPPLPPPPSPLPPLRIQKVTTSTGVVKEQSPVKRISVVDLPELESHPLPAEAPAEPVVVERKQTVRKPVPPPANMRTKSLPPIPPPETQKPVKMAVRSTSRATINPVLDRTDTEGNYIPDSNEAYAALNIRTGDPFYSPTSKKSAQTPFTPYIHSPHTPETTYVPRPAPQVPHQANMLPGMPKRRVELPRFNRTVRQTPTAPVPVKETPFFLDVRTPGSKTVYSSSPPLAQQETLRKPTTPSIAKQPSTRSTVQLSQPPVPPIPQNLQENLISRPGTSGTRPRATTLAGTSPPKFSHPTPPVPPIPRNIPIPPLPQAASLLSPPPIRPYAVPPAILLNRNSEPIVNGNEHVLSHYTPGTLITVQNAENISTERLYRVDPPKNMGNHWRSKSSSGSGNSAAAGGGSHGASGRSQQLGQQSSQVENNPSARYTMKERLKAFKLGSGGNHGVLEIGQGDFGGNYMAGGNGVGAGAAADHHQSQQQQQQRPQQQKHQQHSYQDEESNRERKEVKRHASKQSLSGWGRLRSGVFGN